MPRNEDGEFELVLGNRQLLSVFFIVVILMGVFFTMGYIVGRNSAPAVTTELAQQTPPKPMAVDTPAKAPEPVAEKPAPKPIEEPAAPPEKKAEKKEKEKADKKEKKAKAEIVVSGKPVAGAVYLQIAAVDEKAAEIMVSTLKQKGFSALSTQVPEKPQFYRVCVGPFADASAIAQGRAKLNAAGFRGNDAIKKTF
ncbi:MAG: SPOR domain-containing protein [Bryobacteraceae bacterium]